MWNNVTTIATLSLIYPWKGELKNHHVKRSYHYVWTSILVSTNSSLWFNCQTVVPLPMEIYIFNLQFCIFSLSILRLFLFLKLEICRWKSFSSNGFYDCSMSWTSRTIWRQKVSTLPIRMVSLAIRIQLCGSNCADWNCRFGTLRQLEAQWNFISCNSIYFVLIFILTIPKPYI